MKKPLVTARLNPDGYLEALARPDAGRRGEILASFLQSDVQSDLGCVGLIRDRIAAARRGEAPQPRAIGNAFALALTPDGATIENVVLATAPRERYALDELEAALAVWIAALAAARRRER